MTAESGCVPCGGEAGWHGPGCPAAPVLVESAPVTRAMLALAEELDGEATRYDRPGSRYFDQGKAAGLRDAADRIRATLATVLAADPEPREQVVDGATLIATERRRQVEAEGWTPEHDAAHDNGELARAAACYALPAEWRDLRIGYQSPRIWPWHWSWWKPRPDDRIRELVKAGALIAAEIDRLAAAALNASRGGTQ